jgi:acyl-CoA thioester hydrolase
MPEMAKIRAMADAPTAGSFKDGVHTLPVRVYYEDTDFTGLVYHANYLKFLERGRSDSLRAAGVEHVALAQRTEPLAFAVRRVDIAFLKPARIDDALTVRTSYPEIAGARITARQDIFRGAEKLVSATVEVVCIAANGRPRRCPADLIAAIDRQQGKTE